MDDATVWQGVTHVFCEVLGEEELTLGAETTAADIENWDSVTHIQLLVAVEKKFGVRINTGEAAALANVGELVELIVRRCSQK